MVIYHHSQSQRDRVIRVKNQKQKRKTTMNKQIDRENMLCPLSPFRSKQDSTRANLFATGRGDCKLQPLPFMVIENG